MKLEFHAYETEMRSQERAVKSEILYLCKRMNGERVHLEHRITYPIIY